MQVQHATNPISRLFVYGTLIRDAAHPMHQVLHDLATFHSKAYLQAKLYRIGDYPGAVLSDSDSDRVYGELYLLNEPTHILAVLDDYEECSAAFPSPHEYQRQRITVVTDQHQRLSAWTYLYQWPVANHQQIPSGYFI